ncbi:MAG: HAD family hydrolase [Candidatus Bathyarchaeota archaeon]|nr:MAG: HAD family hydrolase [Candidatus Bathyarchaeota archaeon]
MTLEAVVFDLGDTIVLTDLWDYDTCLKSMLESFRRDGVSLSSSFEEFKCIYFEIRDQMYHDSEEMLEEVDFVQRIGFTLNRLNHPFNHDSPVLLRAAYSFLNSFIQQARMETYTLALLLKVKKKYKLGLVSNFAFARGFPKLLEHFHLSNLFDAIVVSGEFGLRKPHPHIFEEVLQDLDVEADRAVFVGDSLKADIYGAKRLGFKTILVENAGLRKNPYAVASELDPFPIEPDVRIPTLKELPRALRSFQ